MKNFFLPSSSSSAGDLMVGTTTVATTSTDPGCCLYSYGGITVRRNGNMSYWKTIDTGGYNSHVFLSANTTVGTIVISSGWINIIDKY